MSKLTARANYNLRWRTNSQARARDRPRFFNCICNISFARACYKIFYEKIIGNLMEKLVLFPRSLSLEEQGKFMLGYYHQTQKKYEKKEDK